MNLVKADENKSDVHKQHDESCTGARGVRMEGKVK